MAFAGIAAPSRVRSETRTFAPLSCRPGQTVNVSGSYSPRVAKARSVGLSVCSSGTVWG